MSGKQVFKVSYRDGELFSLVEAAAPDEAVAIARSSREAKSVFRGKPPASVREDTYNVTTPTERDLAWARKCRLRVLTGMPAKTPQGRPRSRKGVRGIQVGVEAKRAVAPISEAA